MKIKKPKKKELVELETLPLQYYHRVGSLVERFRGEIMTREEAEKRGYKACDVACFVKRSLKEKIISLFKGIKL